MVRAPRFLRALVAGAGSLTLAVGLTAGLAAGLGAGWGPLAAPPASAAPAPSPADTPAYDAPLLVRIDALAPSYLPERGEIQVSGVVTNRDDVPWSDIVLYTFLGDDAEPMQNSRQLDAALDVPADALVGDRVTDRGEPGEVDELAPGASAAFTVTVPVSAFDVTRGGVYWFGVHALGESPEQGRDDLADGRARTFLPYVPPRIGARLPTALVVPVLRRLSYAADGSLTGTEQWERTLSPGGRLRDLVEFAAGAGDAPLTWLVDPALPDAVARLAAGNPPRTLGPTTAPPSGPPTADPADPADAAEEDLANAEPDTDGDGDAGGEQQAEEVDPQLEALVRSASGWLDRFEGDLAGNRQVLTLPFGNLDVPAALAEAPGLLDLARAQNSVVLQGWDVESSPALSAPGGFLDADGIAAADDDDTVLVGDQLVEGRAPAIASVEGREAVVTSGGAARGGPGPGRALSGVNLRQRILSEAAVRVNRPDRQPLVVTLPTTAALDDPGEFFAGLDVDWVGLDTVEGIASTTPTGSVAAADLAYPRRQARRQLDAPTFEEVEALIAAGDTLQSILTGNNELAGDVVEQALAGASYAVRGDQLGARSSLNQSRTWVDDRLRSVEISAPRGVTLSSASGSLPATITNNLDQAVTVSVTARSEDGGIVVEEPDPIVLAADSRTTVLLEASATTNRVHNVTLSVTDLDGRPLGSTDELPIRSAQVSDVIWLIMGSGAGLLFLAILVRLVRRVREARRPQPEPVA